MVVREGILLPKSSDISRRGTDTCFGIQFFLPQPFIVYALEDICVLSFHTDVC